ncbi:bifunctional TFIIS-LEDGF domain superfamily/Transcription factor IIS [Babesia duncani]|uniref:Bifunctional TFIIS-LEDGF domain superfamily/Transcription factor IIS n=1 Tax=Babesia duncani TaxID=323732 RepID=A0AAD9UQT2_9APIC|nr:bifunctional TFIIS-LEDGF domain superfamily/Transcription factor IIS [Babesia duncani]
MAEINDDIFGFNEGIDANANAPVPTEPSQISDGNIKIPKKKTKKKSTKKGQKGDDEFIPTADDLGKDDHYDYYVDEEKPSRRRVSSNVGKGKTYFDEVLKRIKERKRKNIKISPEECQAYCRQIVERMIAAAAEDVECIKLGKPGLAKLKMLPVISEISKPAWRHWCITEGIAVALASWLTVLPDGSLPNLSVRSKVLQAAFQLPFQSNDLRDNDLGRIIISLWKHPDECESNRVLIRSIIQKWVRPMLGLATNYMESQQDFSVMKAQEESQPKNMTGAPNTAITQDRINSKLTQMFRSIGSRQKGPGKATRVDLNGVL